MHAPPNTPQFLILPVSSTAIALRIRHQAMLSTSYTRRENMLVFAMWGGFVELAREAMGMVEMIDIISTGRT